MTIFSRFADLLSYPGASLPAVVDACLAELPARTPNDVPRQALLAFRADVVRLGLLRLEDAYTTAFDLDEACTLYVGHHLFGENARRGVFMRRLLEMYREHGPLAAINEPPDYLPLLLPYLDADVRSTAWQELLADAVVPALARVGEALAHEGHPYAPVVRALLAHIDLPVPEATGRGTPV